MSPGLCRTVASILLSFRLVSGAIVGVADMFQPVDGLAVLDLLDSDVGHRGVGRRAVPVFFARRDPDDVAGANLLDRAAVTPNAAEAGDDDQRLPERMGVPGGAGARLEGHLRALYPRGVEGVEERID